MQCTLSFWQSELVLPIVLHLEAPLASELICLQATARLHTPEMIFSSLHGRLTAPWMRPSSMAAPAVLSLQLDCNSSLASRLLLLELACPCAAAGSPQVQGRATPLKSTASSESNPFLLQEVQPLWVHLHPGGSLLKLAHRSHLLVSPGTPRLISAPMQEERPAWVLTLCRKLWRPACTTLDSIMSTLQAEQHPCGHTHGPTAGVCRYESSKSTLTHCRDSSPFAGTRHLLESLEERWMDANMRTGMETGQAADALVIYVYSNSDSEYERNLHFFVERGIADGDGCHYIIVVQEVGASAEKQS